jgi:drug/metabolite transporter (DMT)-like permease
VLYCLLGVLGFSLTFPATRAAVPELGALFVGLSRGVIAALLAIGVLVAQRETWPERRALPDLGVVAIGAVLGFPLFSALGLRHAPAHHGAMLMGATPVFTALFATLFLGERPSLKFWFAVSAGVATLLIFSYLQGAALRSADAWLLCAAACAALAYAKGARLSRNMGGWRVICWALVLALPATLPATLLLLYFTGVPTGSAAAWCGLGYVSAVSMFFAYFAWYRGLATGSIAQGAQLQLLGPPLGMLWSTQLLGESASRMALAEAMLLCVSALAAQRAKVRSTGNRLSAPLPIERT